MVVGDFETYLLKIILLKHYNGDHYGELIHTKQFFRFGVQNSTSGVFELSRIF